MHKRIIKKLKKVTDKEKEYRFVLNVRLNYAQKRL